MFDRVICVDWSGRSKPSPKKPSADAIFTCFGDQSAVSHPLYHRTRSAAMHYIDGVVRDYQNHPGLTLIGFDFSFGYPEGFAPALTGSQDIRALWSWVAERIEDDDQNANNRFEVAAEINNRFSGVGPFWGAPPNVNFVGLPHKGSARSGHGLPEFRETEYGAKGAQSSWKLFTTGSVGSQALLGIARLSQLIARRPDVHIWPFDGPIRDTFNGVILAEIYPSIFPLDQDSLACRYPEETYHIKDAVQVHASTSAFLGVSRTVWNAAYPINLFNDTVKEEGWIAGISMTKGALW